MGDDTPALQAVLDADVWRKRLLADQDVSITCLDNLCPQQVRPSDLFCRELRNSWLR